MRKDVQWRDMTLKQRGDAAEQLVAGLLGLSGRPATIMPDIWPGFDLMMHDGENSYRVSVKHTSTRQKSGACWCNWPGRHCDEFDYLALVYFLPNENHRSIWLLTKRQVMEVQRGYDAPKQDCWIDLRHLDQAVINGAELERLL